MWLPVGISANKVIRYWNIIRYLQSNKFRFTTHAEFGTGGGERTLQPPCGGGEEKKEPSVSGGDGPIMQYNYGPSVEHIEEEEEESEKRGDHENSFRKS